MGWLSSTRMGSVVWWAITAAATSLFSFGFPRLLIALGVPLDRWIVGLGAYVDARFTPAMATWLATVVLAISLGLLAWNKRPHQPTISDAADGGSSAAEETQDQAPERAPDPPPTLEQEFKRMRDREDGKLRVERDKGLVEALAYAACGMWGHKFREIVEDELFAEAGNVWQDFRQRAHDQKLTVWGKRSPHGIWVKIDPEFWVDHQPEWFDLLRGIARTEKTGNDARLDRFIDLMVSQTEFEKEWPHGLPAGK